MRRMGDVGLVEKRVFTQERFTTLGGATLKQVRVGWESYGTLNADKSNAVLVTHYFSGTSHAAGRYAASDALPGYWDAVIGPGKAIDTTKYFVISSDTLTNLNAYQWAATYPEMVERIIPVIGAAGGDPFLIAWLGLWAQPITVDPKWNGG